MKQFFRFFIYFPCSDELLWKLNFRLAKAIMFEIKLDCSFVSKSEDKGRKLHFMYGRNLKFMKFKIVSISPKENSPSPFSLFPLKKSVSLKIEKKFGKTCWNPPSILKAARTLVVFEYHRTIQMNHLKRANSNKASLRMANINRRFNRPSNSTLRKDNLNRRQHWAANGNSMHKKCQQSAKIIMRKPCYCPVMMSTNSLPQHKFNSNKKFQKNKKMSKNS